MIVAEGKESDVEGNLAVPGTQLWCSVFVSS